MQCRAAALCCVCMLHICMVFGMRMLAAAAALSYMFATSPWRRRRLRCVFLLAFAAFCCAVPARALTKKTHTCIHTHTGARAHHTLLSEIGIHAHTHTLTRVRANTHTHHERTIEMSGRGRDCYATPSDTQLAPYNSTRIYVRVCVRVRVRAYNVHNTTIANARWWCCCHGGGTFVAALLYVRFAAAYGRSLCPAAAAAALALASLFCVCATLGHIMLCAAAAECFFLHTKPCARARARYALCCWFCAILSSAAAATCAPRDGTQCVLCVCRSFLYAWFFC